MSHNIKKTLDKHWITVEPFTLAGWLTHAGRWVHTDTITLEYAWNQETKSNGTYIYVQCVCVCVLKLPLTCCPEICLSVPVAWRTISQFSKILYSSNICRHKEEKAITRCKTGPKKVSVFGCQLKGCWFEPTQGQGVCLRQAPFMSRLWFLFFTIEH